MRKNDKKMKAVFLLGLLSFFWQSSSLAMEVEYQTTPQQILHADVEKQKKIVWHFPSGITGHIFAGDIDLSADGLEKAASDYVKQTRTGEYIPPTMYGKIADLYLYAALNAVNREAYVRNSRKAVEYAEIYLEEETDDQRVESAEERLDYLLACRSGVLESDAVEPFSQLHASPDVIFRIGDCRASQDSRYPLKLFTQLDGCLENNIFFVEDIFYHISAYLSFADRLTKLGALCSTFRHWSVKIITEFSDKLEFDTRVYPFYRSYAYDDGWNGDFKWDENFEGEGGFGWKRSMERSARDYMTKKGYLPYQLIHLNDDEYIIRPTDTAESYPSHHLLTPEYSIERNIILKPFRPGPFKTELDYEMFKTARPVLAEAVELF
jgi:hypothetical protein